MTIAAIIIGLAVAVVGDRLIAPGWARTPRRAGALTFAAGLVAFGFLAAGLHPVAFAFAGVSVYWAGHCRAAGRFGL